jgi:hypothetical protein
MSENMNRANVVVNLVDVYKEGIYDDVDLTFHNTDVSTFSRTYTVALRGKPEIIPDVPAFPTGHAQVFIHPAKYRYKTVFIHVVGGDEQNVIAEEVWVDPNKADPKLIDFADLSAKSYGEDLLRLLSHPPAIDQGMWNDLDPRNRATILNLCRKMVHEKTDDGELVIKKVSGIDRAWLDPDHRERIYTPVLDGFLGALRALPKNFKDADSSLHHYPNDWLGVTPRGSFKTRDDAGNIQFTFAQDAQGKSYCDIDLDDSAGIKHAFQVIGHKLTQVETDPYDIHEILKHFQNLDPEYRLL